MFNKNGTKEHQPEETIDLRKNIQPRFGKSGKSKDIKKSDDQDLPEVNFEELIYDERISWVIREIFWIDLSELKNFLVELNKFKKRWQ